MWSIHRSLGPIAVAALATLLSAPQDKKKKDSDATLPTQAQLEARYLAAEPGLEHERLAKLKGKWTVDVREWARPEDRQAMRWKAVAEGRSILGRRFVELRVAGKHGKRKVEELLLLGFDRRRSEYTLTRLDTNGTHTTSASGKWSRDLKQISFEGVDDDPTLGRRERFRYDLRTPNENEFRLYRTVFGRSAGGFRNLVVIGRRTK